MTEQEKLNLKGKETKEQIFFVYMERKTILDIRKKGGGGTGLKGKEGQGTGRNRTRKRDEQKEWRTGLGVWS